mgnify:CR=1 FL=1
MENKNCSCFTNILKVIEVWLQKVWIMANLTKQIWGDCLLVMVKLLSLMIFWNMIQFYLIIQILKALTDVVFIE